MGQKTSPLSIRTNNNYVIWSNFENYAFHYKIRSYILNFLHKKGILVNDLAIKKDNDTLYINLNFFISKSSILYIKKFRKLIKKKTHVEKKKQNSFFYFLKTLNINYNIKKKNYNKKKKNIKKK